jgi:uncharacterized protein (DUF1501 family)
MKLTRRTFLKSASATAVLASTHVLSFTSRASAAAGGGRILVLIDLSGGNDGLNTVIPLNNVGAAQRSLYDTMRPDLGIPLSALSGTGVDPDPDRGTDLAMHPVMTGMKTLYDEGKVAVVNGAGLDNSSLSHFQAEKVWFAGDPQGLSGTGWMGRQMDIAPTLAPRAISFNSEVNPTFLSLQSSVLGVGSLDNFDLPDDPDGSYRDLSNRLPVWQAMYGDARPPGSLVERVGQSGGTLVQMIQTLDQVETSGWGSNNDGVNFSFARNLRHVASILRHDALNPGSASGLCFFHVTTGGYDTHSQQGTTDTGDGHPRLLDRLSRALFNFQRDLEGLGIDADVATVVYSEFGRRGYQNDSGSSAGTDHGRSGTMFLVGTPVAGGVHTGLPDLANLDGSGSLEVKIDFREVYAAVIDQWLGGDHTAILPGAPFTPPSLFV